MADHTLGTIRGTIEIDYDGAGIVKATRDTDRLKKSDDKLSDASSKVLSSFGKFSGGAVKVAGAIGAVSNVSSILAGTLAVVGPLAAAGFAAAPAVILGYASTMIVAKLAVAGVGDALKAAGEDQKTFDKSIKGLAPEAQKFAKGFRAALPALQGVQKSMQNAFFKGSSAQVGGVVKAVTALKPAATAVAGSLGEVAQNVVKTATSGKNIGALKAILGGVNSFLQRIKASIGPVVTGFLNLAKQGAAFGGTVGGKLSDALASLARWLSTIDLKSIFAKAAPVVQALGQFLGDVAVIAQSLFGIFIGDGSNAAGVLGTLASGMADFLQSAQGQAVITSLRDAMAAISGSVGQIFLTLLQALAPAIVALAPGAGELANQIAGVLVPAITALAPLLQDVAQYLSDNIGWLGPLAGAVVAAAAGYKVYAAAATVVATVQKVLNSSVAVSTVAWIRNAAAVVASRVAMVAAAGASGVVRAATVAWTAVQWLLNAALAANPIGLVVIAIAALVAGLIIAYRNSEAFRNIVTAVWSAIKTAIGSVVNWITGTVWPSLQRAWASITSGVTTLWGAITAAWNGIKNAISAVLSAIASIISSVWGGIVSVVTGAVNGVKNAISVGFNAAKSVISTMMNAAKAVVNSIMRGIVSVVKSGISGVKSAIAGVSAVVTTVRNAFDRVKSAISEKLSSAVAVVRSFPGKVAGALGGLGSLLYDKGKTLVQGFINGIKSMIGSVGSAAKSVVGAVTRWLPGSPAEVGPLSGKGYVMLRGQRFVEDFARGVKAKSPTAISAVARLSSNVSAATRFTDQQTRALASGDPGLIRFAEMARRLSDPNSFDNAKPPLINVNSAAALRNSGGSSGTQTIEVNIGQSRFATLVLDTVTGNAVTVSKAANEGNRKSKWSGSGRRATDPKAL
jgi:phage-related protein